MSVPKFWKLGNALKLDREETMDGFCYDKLREKWLTECSERKRISEAMKTEIMTKGQPVFRKFGIHKVWVFGSVADGRAQENSDIDMLAIPLPADQYWICRRELEHAVSYPIDLYTQDDDPKFTDKVIKRGEIIYEVQS